MVGRGQETLTLECYPWEASPKAASAQTPPAPLTPHPPTSIPLFPAFVRKQTLKHYSWKELYKLSGQEAGVTGTPGGQRLESGMLASPFT